MGEIFPHDTARPIPPSPSLSHARVHGTHSSFTPITIGLFYGFKSPLSLSFYLLLSFKLIERLVYECTVHMRSDSAMRLLDYLASTKLDLLVGGYASVVKGRERMCAGPKFHTRCCCFFTPSKANTQRVY